MFAKTATAQTEIKRKFHHHKHQLQQHTTRLTNISSCRQQALLSRRREDVFVLSIGAYLIRLIPDLFATAATRLNDPILRINLGVSL